MATLNGTALKDTYTGLLKTSDASGFTTTAKSIESGDGTISALKLSTTLVEAASLKITNIADGSGDTSVLSVNASNEVRKITLTTSPLSGTYSGTSDPTATLTASGGSTTMQFKGGDGITVSRGVLNGTQVFTFDYATPSASATVISNTTVSYGLSASTSVGKTILFPLERIKSTSPIYVSLPALTAVELGDAIKFVLYGANGALSGTTTITTNTGDKFVGSVLMSNDNTVLQDYADGSTHSVINIGTATNYAGSIGDEITVIKLSNTQWGVSGHLSRSGTIAVSTVFS